MEGAIILVWVVTLLGASGLTVLIVAELVRIVHHAREIDRLGKLTLPSAVGIVENTAVIAALEGVLPVVSRLVAGAGAIDATSASIARRVAAVRRALGGGAG
ncbi:MAG: hypothetical protein H0V74_08145 [Chloroflexi bacterium]|nr:hypothetical protein [Chloroflexota bacterium]